MLERYYIEKEKQEKLLSRKNVKSDFYNGIYDRYEYPVLTREHIPLTWRYDLNPKTNPYFMERLGINAVMNSGAIELNGKYYLVARIEGNDRKSFFGVAESDNGVDGFRFWDYPILLDWWIKYSYGRHLYVGHSMGNGADEIERQIGMLREKGIEFFPGGFFPAGA